MNTFLLSDNSNLHLSYRSELSLHAEDTSATVFFHEDDAYNVRAQPEKLVSIEFLNGRPRPGASLREWLIDGPTLQAEYITITWDQIILAHPTQDTLDLAQNDLDLYPEDDGSLAITFFGDTLLVYNPDMRATAYYSDIRITTR